MIRFRTADTSDGGGVVIDYWEARDAIAAQKLLARAGIAAVYVPDQLVRVSDDPDQTLWVAQRLRVPRADDVRAAVLLEEHDLLGQLACDEGD